MSKPETSIFDDVDPDVEERAIREAEEAIKQGRVISHEAIKKWLLSWGTPKELPPPKCGE